MGEDFPLEVKIRSTSFPDSGDEVEIRCDG